MTSEYAGLRTFIAMLRILYEISYCMLQVWPGVHTQTTTEKAQNEG